MDDVFTRIFIFNRRFSFQIITRGIIELDEEMEHQCPNCGCYVPSGTTTCLLCKCRIDQDKSGPGPIDELLDELSAMLNDDEAVERNAKGSEDRAEAPLVDAPRDEAGGSRKVRKKVVYKKVMRKRA